MWNGEYESEVSDVSLDTEQQSEMSSDSDFQQQHYRTPQRRKRPQRSVAAAAATPSRLIQDFDNDFKALQKLARTPSRTKNGNVRKLYNNTSRLLKAKGGRRSPERVLALLAAVTKKRTEAAMQSLPQCHLKCCMKPDENDVYSKVRAYVHLKFNSKNEAAQREFITASIRAVPQNGSYTSSVPYSMPLCVSCFCLYNGIAKRTYERMRPKAESQTASFQRRLQLRRAAGYLPTVKIWMEQYAKEGGEMMPHNNIIYLNEPTWSTVFNVMQEQNPSLATMGFSTFNALRYKHLGHIKLRSRTVFATCDYCNQLQDNIARTIGPQKDEFKRELREHDEWQRRERAKKDKHIYKAAHSKHNRKCAVIEIDGMDKTKTQLGRRRHETKSTNQTEKMGAHVTGAQVHYNGETKTYGYVSLDRYPTATDHVVTVLLDALVRSGVSAEGSQVDTLYIWLDNCTRENKSRFMLAVMHCLIQRGCFMKVVVNYLPVGHTHDRVDQVFSCVSRKLRQMDIMTMDDLCTGLTEAYPGLEVVKIDAIGAYTARVHYCANNNVDGITYARSFRFMRDENGAVRHWYRNNCQTTKKQSDGSEDNWMPYNGEALAMFENDIFPDMTRVLKQSPTPLKTKGLRETADMCYEKGYMTQRQQAWWHTQLDTFAAEDQAVCSECVRLRMLMKANPKKHTDQPDVKKKKQRTYKKAYDDLFKHLQEEQGHELFKSMLPFPAVLWKFDDERMTYEHALGPPVALPPLSNVQIQLLQEVRDQRREGVAVHSVGKSHTSQVARRREMDKALDSIQVGSFCIAITDSNDPPWYVAEIEDVEFENGGAKDADGRATVYRVFLRELGNGNNGGKSNVLGTHKYKYTNNSLYCRKQRVWVSKDEYNIYKEGSRHSAGFKLADAHWEYAHSLAVWKSSKEDLLTNDWKVRADVLKLLAENPRIKSAWPHISGTGSKPAAAAAKDSKEKTQKKATKKKRAATKSKSGQNPAAGKSSLNPAKRASSSTEESESDHSSSESNSSDGDALWQEDGTEESEEDETPSESEDELLSDARSGKENVEDEEDRPLRSLQVKKTTKRKAPMIRNTNKKSAAKK